MIFKFKKEGPSSRPLLHNGVNIEEVTYEQCDNGTFIVYTKEDKSNQEKVNPSATLEVIRSQYKSMGWIEFTKTDESTPEVKCECGAAFTSNPDLHSPLMPCPLYRKGA